ncbi:MAG: HlyD family efflux transporter periplasmic adaptor subunit [Rubrivivax sp.]
MKAAAWLLPIALALAGCGNGTVPAPMSGYAEAELVYVGASAAGTLQSLAVNRGDRVARGQALFALDSDAELLGRESAQARHERAAAQVADLGKGRRPLELKALDEQLVQARAALAASTGTLARNRQLVEQGFVSALQLEDLVAARDRDAARVAELEAQRALALQATGRRDAIAAAGADVRGAQADLALARWRESQKQRSAPADALVYDVMFRPGEFVPAGAPVVALLPPGALKVRFFVPEPLLPQAQPGREVSLACDGCPAGLTARIRYVSPQAEFTPPVIYSNGSRSKLVFMVEATPADARALKPGQPLDVRFAAAP